MTMTVNELDALAGYRFDAVATSSDYVRFANDVGVASDEYASVEVRSMTPRSVRKTDVSRKVLRRLHGFLIDIGQTEAKVAFVEGDATYEYYLPAMQLRAAKITAENQPFEMDEFVSKTDDETTFGYVFRPLALPKDALAGSFALDPERERKRNLIFKAFGNAQD